MAKGLIGKSEFYNKLTSTDKKTFDRLVEIEIEDERRCANCGGEDCICCEYYLDRQKWVSPEELFPYANEDIPGIDSEEFLDWIAANNMEDWDPEDAYWEFQDDWLHSDMPDFMY